MSTKLLGLCLLFTFAIGAVGALYEKELITPPDDEEIEIKGEGKPVTIRLDKPHLNRVIIEKENRKILSDTSFPWRAIGKIRFGKNARWMCTGSLVGPRHVLTNSHCLEPNSPVYFAPGYNNGLLKRVYFPAVAVAAGNEPHIEVGNELVRPENFDGRKDWAILTLNQDVGTSYGYLGVVGFKNEWFKQPLWVMVGYPGSAINAHGEFPVWQSGCTIYEVHGPLFHDCDSEGGSSGSPIFSFEKGKPYIGALNWGERGTPGCKYNADDCHNVAVDSSEFIGTLEKLLKK